jgi:hypothetical protein
MVTEFSDIKSVICILILALRARSFRLDRQSIDGKAPVLPKALTKFCCLCGFCNFMTIGTDPKRWRMLCTRMRACDIGVQPFNAVRESMLYQKL